MSTDRLESDFCCGECNKYFDSASYLLTHFAFHATQEIPQNSLYTKEEKDEGSCATDKKSVPDLYPINVIKYNQKDSNNPNVQIEIDSDFNPLKFCSISMETKDSNKPNEKTTLSSESKKKYPCSHCSKVFGWSTDLKRHLLVHTGERPFKCKICNASFTRNFLLQKHENKIHQNKNESMLRSKTTLPSLKPIKMKTKDSRKQDKQKIKKCFYEPFNKKNDEFHGFLRSQLNFIDKETIVQ